MWRSKSSGYGSDPKVTEVRAKVSAAFRKLRKDNFIARANYLCCQTCAGFSLAERVSKMPYEKAKRVKGLVFYHAQDLASLMDDKGLYLAHGPIDTTAHGHIGLSDEQVGQVVSEALRAEGLTVEWDGDPNQRIYVKQKEV